MDPIPRRCRIKIRGLILLMLCVSLSTFAQPMSIRLEQIARLLEQGKFKAALAEAKAIKAAINPTDKTQEVELAGASLLLSRCYQSLFYPSDSASLNAQESLILLSEENGGIYFEALVQHGNIMAAQRKYQEALPLLQTALAYFEEKEQKPQAANTTLALGIWHLRQGNFEAASSEFQKALYLLQTIKAENTLTAAQCHNQTGYALWQLDQFDAAIIAFKNAETIFLNLGGAENNYLAGMYVTMSACYNDMGLPRKAIACLEKALPNFLSQRKDHPILTNVYNNLGNSYGALGEYTLAIRYLEKVVALQSDNGRYWNNLGDAYLNAENYDKAESSLHKALELLPVKTKSDSLEIARPYHNLSIVFRAKKSFHDALEHALRSIPYRKSGGFYMLDVARSYLGVGECYLALQQYRNAIAYLDTALTIQMQVIPSGLNGEIASVYLAKAICLKELGDFVESERLINNALAACSFQNDNFKEVNAPLELLSALEQKGTLLQQLFSQNNDFNYLEIANDTYELAAQAIQYFRANLLENRSKAAIADQYRSILAGGVEVAYQLWKANPTNLFFFERALTLAEQNKSLTLLEGLRESGAVAFAGIPTSLLTQEKAFQQAISDFEIRLYNLKPTDTDFQPIKDSLFVYQRDYEAFQKRLSNDYPTYFNFKYNYSLATIESIRNTVLQPDQTLLEYFIGESSIYAFIIQWDKHEIVEIKKDFPLEDLVEQLREGLYGYYSAVRKTDELGEKTLQLYISTAQQLYRQLILPLKNYLTNHIIIIPDGVLGYIPFETLLSAPPGAVTNFNTYSFLLQNYQISYCYSATLLQEMMQKKHQIPPSKTVLAMAPFYEGTREELKKQTAQAVQKITLGLGSEAMANRKLFKPLPKSGEEAFFASELWKGSYFIHTEATKKQFLQLAKNYRILHLSTHGVADSRIGDYSYLAFTNPADRVENELLYVRDLYNLQLNTDLVILSACETGVGELQRGEGIISLARAFAYAGAKSMVTSLWVANDTSTKELMTEFHKQLRKGKTKDEALQTAKLEYLKNYPGNNAHPFFWAGFIGVGDMSAIK